MITLHDILCILGWHSWEYSLADEAKRSCLRCPCKEEFDSKTLRFKKV